MVRRWTALGVVTAEKKFRRIKGYRHIGALVHALEANRNLLTAMSLLPKSIHRCRCYPTKFNSGRDIPWRKHPWTNSVSKTGGQHVTESRPTSSWKQT